ncbi:aminoglycoside nucleotidyltransferase ANT9, partial [Klebsiella pneumoniae]
MQWLLPDIPFSDVRRAIMDSSEELIDNYQDDETNSILTLCRMILTMDTGKIIPKDIAGNAVA